MLDKVCQTGLPTYARVLYDPTCNINAITITGDTKEELHKIVGRSHSAHYILIQKRNIIWEKWFDV